MNDTRHHRTPNRSRSSIRAGAALLAVCGALADVGAQVEPPAGANRPDRYAAGWGQFFLDTYTNPRQLSIFRLGAGEARPAEYRVYEWVDGGRRLRPLHSATLRAAWVPWAWRAEGDGRYLLTFDDRFSPPGTTGDCVVIYDFVRGETVAKRADDFMPAEWIESGDARSGWSVGPAFVDPLLHRIYPSGPDNARRSHAPFVVIDLPSLTVGVEPAPESLPERVYRETADGHAFEWRFSMGEAAEPDWLAPRALPTFLEARCVRPLQDMSPFGAIGEPVYFRLDKASGDYLRCTAAEWREPPTQWAEVKK